MNSAYFAVIIALILFTTNIIPAFGRGAIASSPDFVDEKGEKVTQLFVGKQVFVTHPFVDLKITEGNYVSIMQIKDRDGFIEQVSWVAGRLNTSGTAQPIHRWTPDRTGDFTVDLFLWTDLEKPRPISVILETTATVSPLVKIVKGSSNPQQQQNFVPKVIKVVLGVNNTVVWLNEDSSDHNVVSDTGEFDSVTTLGYMHPNATWSHTFTKEGVYGYHSEPGPWMRGTVIVESPEKEKSRIRMTLFSHFIGVAGVINIGGINDAVSVKGSLRGAFGKSLDDRDILIYVNDILMGKTRTDSKGCFYFNDWNNTKLKSMLDKYANIGVFGIKIKAVFPGDDHYTESSVYDRDSVYTSPPPLPMPNNYIPTTEAQVNAGSSVDVPVVIQVMPHEVMLNVTLSLDALPCEGVSYSVNPSFFPKLAPKLSETGEVTEEYYNETSQSHVTKKYEVIAGNTTIHISTDSKLKAGHYTFVIVGDAIMKDLNLGEEKHLKEPFGLLHLIVTR